MVKLTQQDLHRLIEILQRFSEFEDEKSRRNFLPMVGLGLLIPRMDLTGPPFIASMKIVNFLSSYGRLTNEMEALGSLLEGLHSYLGQEDWQVVNEIITKYSLLSPASRLESYANPPSSSHTNPSSQRSLQGEPPAKRTDKVIIIGSSIDQLWLERVKTQLALLERLRFIELWDESRIMPGSHKEQALSEALNTACVALLLISANFLGSEEIMEQKLPPILSKHAQGKLAIFPLILSHCLYQESPLGIYTTFNAVDQPLSLLPRAQAEEVLVRLARSLQQAIEQYC